MAGKSVAIIGASSLVGKSVLDLLADTDWRFIAYSRTQKTGKNWQVIPDANADFAEQTPYWISLAPLPMLPDYFARLERAGARRIVALSSTSLFTKSDSPDAKERDFVAALADAEARLQNWAESRGVEWIILRPTLIYGHGMDKNISEIARFIKRFGFFPVLGKASGLRQPVHADDVANACLAALSNLAVKNKAYTVSGAEKLSYRDMVIRIFNAMNRTPRLLTVPVSVFRLAVACLRCFPRYRYLSSTMAERMNLDMAFDYRDAERDLSFSPGTFQSIEEN